MTLAFDKPGLSTDNVGYESIKYGCQNKTSTCSLLEVDERPL